MSIVSVNRPPRVGSPSDPAKPKVTARGREVGNTVRALMSAANLTGQELARMVGWDPSTVTRMLQGMRRVRDVDLATVLAVLQVGGYRRERLLDLQRDCYEQTWVQEYDTCLPADALTLAAHEETAEQITVFVPGGLPDLVQTAGYARALLESSATIPTGEVEDRMTARVARQRILHRSGAPILRVLVNQAALDAEVGDADTMVEQRRHLAWLSRRRRDNVIIRIIPAPVSPHAGAASGFTLMESSAYTPVVCVETEVIALFLEKEPHVKAYRAVADTLTSVAWSLEESRTYLADLASGERAAADDFSQSTPEET